METIQGFANKIGWTWMVLGVFILSLALTVAYLSFKFIISKEEKHD